MADPQQPAARIAQWVLRFEGYDDVNARSRSDTVFREYLIDKLEQMTRMIGGALDHFGQNDEADRYREAMHQAAIILSEQAHRVRSVPYAFGEFMMAKEIDEALLADFYERDEAILTELSRLNSVIDPTVTESTDFIALIKELDAVLKRLSAAVKARQAAISDFLLPPPSREE